MILISILEKLLELPNFDEWRKFHLSDFPHEYLYVLPLALALLILQVVRLFFHYQNVLLSFSKQFLLVFSHSFAVYLFQVHFQFALNYYWY